MPPKSTAREKNIGKSQTNVPLWAHACRHKSSIHLQQSVYSYFWGFTGCKYKHRLFDKKRWTNTQVDAIFWARAAVPKLSVINPTLITAYSWHFIARLFSSSPRLLDSRDSLNISISHSLTSPVVQVAWGGIAFKLLGITAMRNYSANRKDCKLKALDKRSQIKEDSWLVLLRGRKNPNRVIFATHECFRWVILLAANKHSPRAQASLGPAGPWWGPRAGPISWCRMWASSQHISPHTRLPCAELPILQDGLCCART